MIDRLKKALTIHCNFIHTQEGLIVALCQLALHLEKEMLKKMEALEESSSLVWAYISPHLHAIPSKEDTNWGIKLVFASKLVQKPI